MDKEHVRILITILTAVLIFGVQAIIERVKKRREEIRKAYVRPRVAPASPVPGESVRPPFVDYELSAATQQKFSSGPVDSPDADQAAAQLDDMQEECVPPTDDLRRAMIWSEILNRKYY